MIAYNSDWLDNLLAQARLREAFLSKEISADEYQQQEIKFPAPFYSTHYFARIGLFLLTLIISGFSLGLLSLMFLSAIEDVFTGLVIIFGLLNYGALEYFIREKKHYRSGVDDALLYLSFGYIATGICFAASLSAIGIAFVLFILSAFAAIRFADMLMTCVAVASICWYMFEMLLFAGTIAVSVLPFVFMLFFVLLYFSARKARYNTGMRHYESPVNFVMILALLGCYAAGNYFVVHELSVALLNIQTRETQSMPLGWLFWLFTISIPFVYLLIGIRRKEVMFIWAGSILIAVAVFTIRYYFAKLNIEIVMLLSGILLIVIAYVLMKYLAVSKGGFTSVSLSNNANEAGRNIEALIIAETFSQQPAAPHTRFGGGDFGGGGSSGEF